MADIYERFLYENMWTKTIIRNLSIVGDEEEQRLIAAQLCFVGVLVWGSLLNKFRNAADYLWFCLTVDGH